MVTPHQEGRLAGRANGPERSGGPGGTGLFQVRLLPDGFREQPLRAFPAGAMALMLQNTKEKNMIDLAKHNDNMELQAAKLQLEADKQGIDINLDIMDKQAELAKTAAEIEEKKIDIAEKAMGVIY